MTLDASEPASIETPFTPAQEARLAAAKEAADILRSTTPDDRRAVEPGDVIKLAYWIINAPNGEGAHR